MSCTIRHKPIALHCLPALILPVVTLWFLFLIRMVTVIWRCIHSGQGASEFGFIVAGSNVIRNGYERTEYALQVLTGDVTSRYPVDKERMYAAGFSGGGRVAQEFSQRNPDIKAIASMGAGYSVEQAGMLRNKASMLFIAGNEDFNYHEIRNSYQILSAAGIHYYILEYPGKHAWPGPEIIRDALQWFEFDDYRRNPAHTAKTGREESTWQKSAGRRHCRKNNTI